jgi:hypothetical protein
VSVEPIPAQQDPLEILGELRGKVRAFHQFRNEVGALMLRLVEINDPVGLVLLEFVRDLEARMAEFDVSEETV